MIIDLGANHGETIKFFSVFYPEHAINGYEPDRVMYKSLIERFKNSSKIKLYNCAIGKHSGSAIFFDMGGNHEGGGITDFRKDYIEGRSVISRQLVDSYEVTVLSINEIIKSNASIIKIDIEGMEYDVLFAMKDELYRKIKLLIIEFHFDDEAVPYTYKDMKECLNKLSKLGFKGISYDTKNWVFYRNIFSYLRFKYSKLISSYLKIVSF